MREATLAHRWYELTTARRFAFFGAQQTSTRGTSDRSESRPQMQVNPPFHLDSL